PIIRHQLAMDINVVKVQAILANFLQQKKCIKDPVKIHHIKQREEESIEDFMQRFKAESRHVKRASECMRISEFMYEITNPGLIKRLHDNIPKSVDEMMRAEKLSHVIKELKQGSRKDQPKAAKKGETSRKDNPLEILMVQPWQRVTRQRITQSFSPNPKISFPPLGNKDEMKSPMIIEADLGGHFIHRIYVDGGSDSEILYEHCFNRLRPKVKNQMVSATAPLIGFSEEIIWPMEQILLTVKIGDAKHSTYTWMNFVVVRSPSSYNGIIGRPGQDNPTRMHDGLWTGSTTFLHHSSCRGKDQRVPRHLAEHRLNVREGCLRVRQKKRSQAPERNKAIQEEVAKHVDTEIMKEVHYHSCVSNPIMVKKHDDSWRMCVDFKDLNKACPKDGYPLLEIN
nr:reverse transcriptase domain-containing protein [Tanacetum cinerariifolium]